ncbi:hypothetical protein ACP8HI_00805 [Paenibacillus sp. FA6]|uniref:hypothetical protein n=1 Tax=Paenibacillus sp. FA6 TaxID=3413029 RepID=UPI003F656048
MMDNILLIDEIVKYYMNPKTYPNKDKNEVEKGIKELDRFLLDKNCEENEFFSALFERYTSDNVENPINSTIRKTRADEQGLSATKGYKEIYFNEIIQNANDNTTGESISIILSNINNNYEMSFLYEDSGFKTENIIGFFNTEIHTKRSDLSTTGKHGVGIKSLFYFVDHMTMESNVKIEFKVKTINEDGIDKIEKVSSNFSKNAEWDGKTTRFTIRFPQKESYGEFNVAKLKKFIDSMLDKTNPIQDETFKQYFFGLNQEKLIFDVRGLLFTDKNKGKKKGIKKIYFHKNDDNKSELFTISCDESNSVEDDGNRVCKATLKCNEEERLSYLMFIREGEGEQQNFSVAFPLKPKRSRRRYYETYYISEADDEGIDILVNSKYSNVARTKLTDEDNKIKAIKEEIEGELIEIYKFMVSKKCADSDIGEDISKLFHSLLIQDNSNIDLFYENEISNRFLARYIKSDEPLNQDLKDRYLVYQRKDKEDFEKQFIIQKFTKENVIEFFVKSFVANDCIKYDEKLFIEELKEIYNQAFQVNQQSGNIHKLKTVLNIAGSVRELIYYRITGNFPNSKEQQPILRDAQVDAWHEKLWVGNIELIDISYSMIGRYKLHNHIDTAGKITGASFYEYLFNQSNNENQNEQTNSKQYPTLEGKQEELFDKQYNELKIRLLDLVVNKEQSGEVELPKYPFPKKTYKEGTVVFYGSDHHNAGNEIYCHNNNFIIYDYINTEKKLDSNTDKFGDKLSENFVKKILDEDELIRHIICIGEKIMLASSKYPLHKNPTCTYWRSEAYVSGEWFECQLININFLRRIYAHTFESFKFYVEDFLEKSDVVSKWGDFTLDTAKSGEPLFSLNINDIPEIFKFFYTNRRYSKLTTDINKYKITFNIKLLGDITNNLCPSDYIDHVFRITKKKIYVMQTNKVGNRDEVMYWHKGSFKIWGDNDWNEIGKGNRNRNSENEIIIIHNEKMDYKKAINKVLKDIFGNGDMVDKCEVFISEGQRLAIQGEEYNKLSSCDIDINPRYRRISCEFDANRLSCDTLKKIITARGNNDNKCCCCGRQLTNSKLIITNNCSEKTKKEYPQVFEVVCEDCEKVLSKSLKNTEIIKEENSYYVRYKCEVNNSHQIKEVIYKTKLYDGILALCKRKVIMNNRINY